MQIGAYQIQPEDPTNPALAQIHARHTAAMHADTPPESIHMLPASALKAPGIDFFVLRADGVPVGMGALKRLSADHAEIKSMHVLAEMRGKGLAQALLNHLIEAGRKAGYQRLSLETGSQDSFAAARALYLRAGFTLCPPFADYWDDPNSTFMTIEI